MLADLFAKGARPRFISGGVADTVLRIGRDRSTKGRDLILHARIAHVKALNRQSRPTRLFGDHGALLGVCIKKREQSRN